MEEGGEGKEKSKDNPEKKSERDTGRDEEHEKASG